MAHRIVWAVAALMAALALVAGCINVDVPKGPYVVAGDSHKSAAPADQRRVSTMDKPALEQEVLRLTGENDDLRQEVEKLKRENKILKADRDHYKDQVENLQDQLKEMRKR